MITGEQAMALLFESNPVPDLAVLDASDTRLAVLLEDLAVRSNEMTKLKTEDEQVTPAPGRRWFAVAAIAAFVALVVTAVVLTRSGDQSLVGQPQTPTETARAFVQAYRVDMDLNTARSYVAEGVDVLGPNDEAALLMEYLQAVGTKNTLGSCEELGTTAEGSQVKCSYEYHMLRSDEMGLGPFEGATLITVSDDKVVSVEDASDQSIQSDPFSIQVWDPFRLWVLSSHPDDYDVMYDGTGWRITEESIPLWEQLTKEYVAEQG